MSIMNSFTEKLKASNPAICQILCEQEKHKWEITKGVHYKTVNDTSSYEVSFKRNINLKNDIVCPPGVKF